MSTRSVSMRWIVLASVVFGAALGWVVLAASYSSAHSIPLSEISEERREEWELSPGSYRRRGRRIRQQLMVESLGGMMSQLFNPGDVISWHMQNRIWLPVLILCGEAGLVVGGAALVTIERRHKRHR